MLGIEADESAEPVAAGLDVMLTRLKLDSVSFVRLQGCGFRARKLRHRRE